MRYILDTNIFAIHSKKEVFVEYLEEKFQLFSGNHSLFVSVATLGELNSLVKQLKYGAKRQTNIRTLLEKVVIIDIKNQSKIIQSYGDIDAYSQGKLHTIPSNFSARNMGKNDLWIAATASAFNLTLITTDKDFNHLGNTFLNLNYVDLASFN